MLSAWSDPIVAMATAPGRGAVGIVRISGKGLQPWVTHCLGQTPTPRMASLLTVHDASHSPIDQVIALWFPAPHSYTGEDVLELQGHGGMVVMQMLIKHCLESAQAFGSDAQVQRMRLARPGEFTERAYLNHKIDLAQAEAVADLIDASSEAAARSATRSMGGAFSKEVHHLGDGLTQLRSLVESTLDFPEEEIDFLQQADAQGQIQALLVQCGALHERSRQGALLRDGMRLVIAGQPNVGKSALLNALSGQDTAIVTDIPGTTRDALTQTIHVDGLPIHVVDTAGLRDHQQEAIDRVEKIGIDRAWQHIDQADAVLFLHDLSRRGEAVYTERDAQIQALIAARMGGQQTCLQVWNKVDVLPNHARVPEHASEIWISAQTGEGMAQLKAALLATVGRQSSGDTGEYSARGRHLQALKTVQAHMAMAQQGLDSQHLQLEVVAEELRLAQLALSGITGEFTADDLLGEIFSRFCIGK